MARSKRKHGNDNAVVFGDKDTRNTLERQVFDEYRHRASMTKTLIILAVIAGFLSIIMVMGNTGRLNTAIAKAESISAHSGNEQPGKSIALKNVNAWLTGNNTPFPGGVTNIMWDGAVKTAEYTENSTTTPVKVQQWVHTFEFTDHDGNVRRVSQNTIIRDGVASAPSDPSILPMDAAPRTTGQSTKPNGYLTLDDSTTLDNLIKTWAKSYVGKDMNAFTVLIADPDTDHVYQPANIGTLENVGQNWAVWQTKPDGGNDDKVRGGYAVVSVTIGFRPYTSDTGDKTTNGDDTTGRTPQTAHTTLSLLVKDPQSGSARIVDWGSDGMIDTLKPYANALSKSVVTATGTSADDEDDTGDTGEVATTPDTQGTPGDAPTTDPTATPTPTGTGTPTDEPTPTSDAQ